MMSQENILVERKDKIAVVTIDRPRRMNAFNENLFFALEQATHRLKKNLPRAVILTGAGNKAFSAGFDVNPDNPMVSSLIASVEKKNPQPAEKMIQQLRQAVDGFLSLPIPIIAALNGFAYGGGAELATRCDLRVMDPDTVICFSEVRLGLMPDWGGGATLARLLGPAIAADLILTARKISADEALRIGLVNRVSQPGKALEEAIALGETIAKNGPRAVACALEVIRQSLSLPLDKSLNLESAKAVSLIMSGECFHGVAAFLEKKEPEFPDIND